MPLFLFTPKNCHNKKDYDTDQDVAYVCAIFNPYKLNNLELTDKKFSIGLHLGHFFLHLASGIIFFYSFLL